MSLKTLSVATATIKTPGGDLAVRGLCLDDIIVLVAEHSDAFTTLFDRFASEDGGMSGFEDTARIAAAVLHKAPAAAALIIALAADEPDAVDIARKQPVSVQIAALEKIGELTFAAEGGAKKVMETVIRVANGVTDLLGNPAPLAQG